MGGLNRFKKLEKLEEELRFVPLNKIKYLPNGKKIFEQLPKQDSYMASLGEIPPCSGEVCLISKLEYKNKKC